MKERPILFQGDMVRALLAGTKKQTRRVVKPQGSSVWLESPGNGTSMVSLWSTDVRHKCGSTTGLICPYGELGDRLRVRETFFAFGRWETRFSEKKGRDEWHFIDMTRESDKAYRYDANGANPQPLARKREGGVTPKWWKRPAIFMPGAASRLTLEITDVRVERLQDISETDAIAEGTAPHIWDASHGAAELIDWPLKEDRNPYRNGYALLWEGINGPGGWDANPWVWVVEFRKVTT